MEDKVVDTELLVEVDVVEVEVVADCDIEVSVECFKLLCFFRDQDTRNCRFVWIFVQIFRCI